MDVGTCALCGSVGKIEISHLLPRFIAKRQKADSPNPFLRDGRDWNRRVQDSPKEPLLCGKCEDLFCDFETAFSRDIFSPTMDGKLLEDLVITREHHKFCASVAWRQLISTLRRRHAAKPPIDDLTAEDWAAIEAGEQALRAFVLGQAPIADIPHHLINVRSTTETEFPGINALVNLTAGFAMRARTDAPGRLYAIIFMNGLLMITLIRSDQQCRSEWSLEEHFKTARPWAVQNRTPRAE